MVQAFGERIAAIRKERGPYAAARLYTAKPLRRLARCGLAGVAGRLIATGVAAESS
jgi:hypothetical protein